MDDDKMAIIVARDNEEVANAIAKTYHDAGILTDDPALVEAASEQFDSVWRGEHCTRAAAANTAPTPSNDVLIYKRYKP